MKMIRNIKALTDHDQTSTIKQELQVKAVVREIKKENCNEYIRIELQSGPNSR